MDPLKNAKREEQQEIERLNQRIESLLQTIDEQQTEIAAYITLVNAKDEYALQLEQQVDQLNAQIARWRANKLVAFASKMLRLARRIASGVKRRVKRVLMRLTKRTAAS